MKLLCRAKSDYFRDIDLGKLTYNQKFWKTVKPLFSDKVHVNSSISLMVDGKMVNQDSQIAKIFNQYFPNITDSLGISVNNSLLVPTSDILDPVHNLLRNTKLIQVFSKLKTL